MSVLSLKGQRPCETEQVPIPMLLLLFPLPPFFLYKRPPPPPPPRMVTVIARKVIQYANCLPSILYSVTSRVPSGRD